VRRGRLILVGLAATIALAAGANAHDHRVPKTVLSVDDQRQQGRLWSAVWQTGDDNSCVEQGMDGVPTFHRPLHVAGRSYRARVRFRKRQEPLQVSLRAYTEFDRRGAPEGGGTRIPFELRRVPPDGWARAWVARFDVSLSDAEPRLMIEAFGRWRDLDGCGGPQTASWTFSLRTP
jgi:hypothetical protein